MALYVQIMEFHHWSGGPSVRVSTLAIVWGEHFQLHLQGMFKAKPEISFNCFNLQRINWVKLVLLQLLGEIH